MVDKIESHVGDHLNGLCPVFSLCFHLFIEILHYTLQVASMFYTLLVLKKQQAVEVEQNEPFGEILISKGPKFELAY